MTNNEQPTIVHNSFNLHEPPPPVYASPKRLNKCEAISLEPPPVYEEPKIKSPEEDTYLQATTTGTTTGKWSVCWVLMAVVMVGLVVIGITSPNTKNSFLPDIKRSDIP